MNKHIFSCLLLFVLLTGVTAAYSQTTYVWTGKGGNTIWETPGNWQVGGVPQTVNYPGTASTDIASFPGSGGISGYVAPPTAGITFTGSVTIGELLIAGGTVSVYLSTSPYTLTTNEIALATRKLYFLTGSAVTIAPGSGTALGSGNVFYNVGGTLSLTNTTVNLGAYTFFYTTGITNTTNCTFNFNGLDSQLDVDGGSFTDVGSTFTFSGNNDGQDYSVGGFFGGTSVGGNSLTVGGFLQTGGTVFNFSQVNTSGSSTGTYAFYNDAAGVSFIDPKSFINLIDPSSLMFNDSGNNGVVCFQSDATGTATLGTVAYGSGAVTGDIFVQRYISPYTEGYRLLSAPVFGATSTPAVTAVNLAYLNNTATLATGTGPVYTYYGAATGGPGGATNGFTIDDTQPGTTNANPTIYLYNESINPPAMYTGGLRNFFNEKAVGLIKVGSTSNTYSNLNMSPTSSSVSFLPGTGFTLYYIGNGGPSGYNTARGASVPASTVTWGGRMNTGTITYTNWAYPANAPSSGLTYTAAAPYPGFNLVGNPYTCTIDLAKVASDNGGSMGFYELDDNQLFDSYLVAGNFQYSSTAATLTSNGTTSAATRYVSSGMGFYVSVTAAQSLLFKEDQKVATQYNPSSLTSPTFLSLKSGGSRAVVSSTGNAIGSIHLALQKDSLTAKSCGIYFNDASSDKFDKFDAMDLDGIAPSVYMSSFTADGVRTTINGMGSYSKGKNIKLYVNAAANGTYQLNLTEIANIDMSVFKVLLIDNYKKDTVNLASVKSYSFSIATADSNSFGANRFILSIQMRPLPPYKLIAFNGAKENSTVVLNWKAANEGDYTGFGVQKLDPTSNEYGTVYSVQSNGAGNYSFVDKSPVPGVNTYRLLQNNVDSLTSYSSALSIIFSSSNIGALSVYPNPAKDVVTVNFNNIGITSDIYNVNIYNSMGVLMMQKSISANSLSQDVSALRPGAYIIEVKTNYGNSIGNAKFVKN